jgi:outer membrane biosynthesis protein TonB
VVLSLIVNPDGSAQPSSIHVVNSVEFELDAEAVRYASRAFFRPGCLSDRPVRVRVKLPIDFQINY